MYAISTSPVITGRGAAQHIARAFQEPRQSCYEQESPCQDRGRLFAPQIANESDDFVEVGVVQKIGDMLEPATASGMQRATCGKCSSRSLAA